MTTAADLRRDLQRRVETIERRHVIRNRAVPGGIRLQFEGDEGRDWFDREIRDIDLLCQDADRLHRLETAQRSL